MTLIFSKKFVEPIISGQKIHTIRNTRRPYFKPGHIIDFCTSNNKSLERFYHGMIKSVQSISFEYDFNHSKDTDVIKNLLINDIEMDPFQIKSFVHNEGFNNENEFISFFVSRYGDCPFHGVLIHWTDFKYCEAPHKYRFTKDIYHGEILLFKSGYETMAIIEENDHLYITSPATNKLIRVYIREVEKVEPKNV